MSKYYSLTKQPNFKLFAYEKESNNYSTKLNKSINLLSFKKNNEDLYQIVKLLSSSLPYDTVLSAEYNKEKSRYIDEICI